MTVSSKFLFGFRSSSSSSSSSSVGRSSDPHPSAGTQTDIRTRHRHRHGHGHGHGSRFHHRDDSDHRISRSEHESFRLERRSSEEFESTNRITGISIGAVRRSKLVRNDRLPDAVLQARARLLERLRGFSLLENSSSDDFGVLEHETPRDSHNESTPDQSKKRPLKLSWEALCSQHRQVFSNIEENDEESESTECCICLEPFCEGDVLIRLHCCHRFHTSCLEPWIQICADCPCCRASVY